MEKTKLIVLNRNSINWLKESVALVLTAFLAFYFTQNNCLFAAHAQEKSSIQKKIKHMSTEQKVAFGLAGFGILTAAALVVMRVANLGPWKPTIEDVCNELFDYNLTEENLKTTELDKKIKKWCEIIHDTDVKKAVKKIPPQYKLYGELHDDFVRKIDEIIKKKGGGYKCEVKLCRNNIKLEFVVTRGLERLKSLTKIKSKK